MTTYTTVFVGTMRTDTKLERHNIIRDDGAYLGCVVRWTYGFIGFDAEGRQLTNRATLADAAGDVANPPSLLHTFDATITVPMGGY